MRLHLRGKEMQVPQEIREVERPKGTIVYAYGKNPVRYGVKKRNFVKVNGKVVQKDGETIGHIVDRRFVPIDNRVLIRYDDSDFLYWADAQLAVNLSGDVFEDLVAVYHRDDALRSYVMALLRATEPELKDDEIKTAYEQSYLSVMYPGVTLSKNVVGQHLYDLGRTYSYINDFMLRRTSRVPENHIVAVDRILKSDESEVNSLSAPSRNALLKGSCNV